jgi:hypothetical protein
MKNRHKTKELKMGVWSDKENKIIWIPEHRLSEKDKKIIKYIE